MAVIKHKPTINGRRSMTSSNFAEITEREPEKTLLESQSHAAGYSSYGHITVRHRDGGHKQKCRIIDFKRSKDDVKTVVKAIEYDPNRAANIALLRYANGIRAYILAPKGLKVDTVVEPGPNADIKSGNALSLSAILAGTGTHDIELEPGKGGQLARSADTVAQVLSNDSKHTLVRLQSGEVRKISSTCHTTIGSAGNEQHSLVQLGRAGRKRRLGKRPQSRGFVMNPNDHPHGGGKGKASVGRPQPMTLWGKKSRGIRAGNSKARSEKLTIRHHKGNKWLNEGG